METDYPIERIAPGDRADHWAQSLKNVCGNFLTISSDWATFKGNIEVRNIGGFDVAGIAMNAEKVIRSRKHIAESDTQYCFLIMQMQGRAVLTQRDNEAFLEPGDMALIDSAYPSEFSYDGFMRQISLHIPRETLESCSPDRRIKEARTISGNSGMGAVIKGFLGSTYHEAPYIYERDFGTVREVLLNLLGATLRGNEAEGALCVKVRQLALIRKIIEQNLTDPCLSPTMVAGLCGLSPRHLHRLFQAEGTSFGEWVRKRRLTEARRQLADIRFSDKSIIQIAFHWGFNDAAHFSRAFKEEFGLSPRQYRLSERRLI